MKKLATYLIIIFLATVSFLFTPRSYPPADVHKWGDFYVPIHSSTGIRVNGDAFAFVALAIEPSHLLDSNQVRQSRPGYIIAAHLLGSAIYVLSSPFHPQLEKFFQSRIKENFDMKSQEKITWWFSCYCAYIILNCLVILLTLWLFDRLVIMFTGPWKNETARWILLFLLLDNPIIKLFFWSPHVQVFNLLLPVLLVWVSHYSVQNTHRPARLYLLSLAGGMLALFYGSFILILPVVVFSILYFYLRSPLSLRKIPWLTLVFITSLFSIPILSWMLAVNTYGTGFYSAELGEYRQFIWISDTLQSGIGVFLQAFFKNSLDFFASLTGLIMPIAILAISALFDRTSLGLPATSRSPLIISVVCCFTFFWLMGYYADRLTYSIAGCFFLIAAIYINQSKRKPPIIWLYALTLIWHILLVTGNPFYFTNIYFN